VEEQKTINYFMNLKNNYSTTSFRKRLYQIRKFLLYLNLDWGNQFKAPPEPVYRPKRITVEDLHKTLEYFKGNQYYKQLKAIIYLGATSGLRAEELYQDILLLLIVYSIGYL
jgi:integrase